MKVGILTFHASHNYGSMLQAYALQKTVESLGHDCEIINFRTIRQRRLYSPFLGWVKTLRYPVLALDECLKYHRFEKFLQRDLKVSKRTFRSFEDLQKGAQGYDAYISGSDQIWNVGCIDWDRSYGLAFVKQGLKIAYAPSMGPTPDHHDHSLDENFRFLAEDVRKYDAISTREGKTAYIVEKMVGSLPVVTLDPTLLLSASAWLKLDCAKPIIKEKKGYILLYSPWQNIELYQKTLQLGDILQMKVVVPMNYPYRTFKSNGNVIFRSASGPKEFLNLISNASLVVGASFHAVAFAVIFKKQFYAFKGLEDQRILSLLQLIGLEQFADESHELIGGPKLDKIYENADLKLQEAKLASIQFLKTSLSGKNSN